MTNTIRSFTLSEEIPCWGITTFDEFMYLQESVLGARSKGESFQDWCYLVRNNRVLVWNQNTNKDNIVFLLGKANLDNVLAA